MLALVLVRALLHEVLQHLLHLSDPRGLAQHREQLVGGGVAVSPRALQLLSQQPRDRALLPPQHCLQQRQQLSALRCVLREMQQRGRLLRREEETQLVEQLLSVWRFRRRRDNGIQHLEERGGRALQLLRVQVFALVLLHGFEPRTSQLLKNSERLEVSLGRGAGRHFSLQLGANIGDFLFDDAFDIDI